MHSQFLSAISITIYRLTKTEKSPKVVILVTHLFWRWQWCPLQPN